MKKQKEQKNKEETDVGWLVFDLARLQKSS